MPDNTALIQALEADLKKVMPTPPLPSLVRWHPENKKDVSVSAMVAAIEGPGQITVVLFAPNAHPKTVKGVRYTDWEGHQQPNNQNTRISGSWSYPDGAAPPKAHYHVHEDNIRRRLDQAKATHVDPKKQLAAAT